MEAAGIDLGQPITLRLKDVTVGEALVAVETVVSTPTAKLGHSASGNIVLVSTGEALSQMTTTRVYDLMDLIVLDRKRYALMNGVPAIGLFGSTAESPSRVLTEQWMEDLSRLMMQTVVTESWRETGGMVGTLYELNGRLIITQTPENHLLVERFLNALKSTGLPGTRPAGDRHAK